MTRTPMRPRVVARLAVSGFALVTGCLVAPPHATPAAAASTRTVAASAPDVTLASIRSALEERRANVRAVRADVVVHVEAPAWAAAGTCEGLLAARRPGSLRLAGYAAIATLFDTATDGRRFWVNLPAAGLVYTGAAGQESLLTALPVPPGQIVAAVFGEPYGALDSTLAVERAGDKATLTWSVGGGRTVRARAALGPLRIERAELKHGESVEATIDYRDYRKRDGVWWPTRIEFSWPAERTRLALDFGAVEFNPAMDDSLFRIPLRPGTLVVDVAEVAKGAP